MGNSQEIIQQEVERITNMFDWFSRNPVSKIMGLVLSLFGGSSAGIWWLEYLTPDMLALIDSIIMSVGGLITMFMAKDKAPVAKK